MSAARTPLGAGALSRRSVMAAGLVTLAGCATPVSVPKARVVVLGGGFGGATAAHYLKLWGSGIDVTLVERNTSFVSCPISNLVLGGFTQMAHITRSYAGLSALGVRVVHAEAVAIDTAGRHVRLADGGRLPYDRLVVSPGIDFIPSQVPGLDPASHLHAWKAGPQTVALRARLEAMPDGGVVAISIPKAPYRCPPGPYERACVIAAYLKQAKPRSKLLLLDANPEVQSKKALFERVFKEQYAGLLEYRPNSELRELDAAGGVAKFEFESVKADVLNVIPPQRAADIARSAGLVNVNDRWAGVDWLTMESTAVPGVHVLGDALFAAPGMPKSGHIANQHAKLAAAAVLQLLAEQPVEPSPQIMNTCYSFVNGTDVIHVASVHRYDAAQKTLLAVPGSGGVSSAPSALEGTYALAWAQNVWSDLGTAPLRT
jgi:sulfite dehydrogenase